MAKCPTATPGESCRKGRNFNHAAQNEATGLGFLGADPFSDRPSFPGYCPQPVPDNSSLGDTTKVLLGSGPGLQCSADGGVIAMLAKGSKVLWGSGSQ